MEKGMPVYNLFASHSWTASDSFERLSELLHMPSGPLSDFHAEFYSISKDDPIQNIPSKKPLRAAIEEKMKSCSCLLVLGGAYDIYKKWIDMEVDIAKKLRKRIIVIEPWKSKSASAIEKKAAHAIVKWDDESVITAIMQNSK